MSCEISASIPMCDFSMATRYLRLGFSTNYALSICQIVLLYLWDPRLDLTSVRCMTKTVGFSSPVNYLSIQVVSKY